MDKIYCANVIFLDNRNASIPKSQYCTIMFVWKMIKYLVDRFILQLANYFPSILKEWPLKFAKHLVLWLLMATFFWSFRSQVLSKLNSLFNRLTVSYDGFSPYRADIIFIDFNRVSLWRWRNIITARYSVLSNMSPPIYLLALIPIQFNPYNRKLAWI